MAAGVTRPPPRGKLSDPVRPWCAVASRSAVGGVRDPPVQQKCTTARSNRTDPARLRLPEGTFTIRAWGRQAVLPRRGAAPASVAAADLSASPPGVCWPGSLVTPDQREVCPLSRGVMLQPLSVPLQGGIRFLPRPLPAAPSARLAVRFPSTPLGYGAGRTTGLPRSADVPEWLGRISTPVARHLRRGSSGPPDLATYLLVQAVQQLALVLCNDACDALPGLAMPLDPGSRPPCCWQSQLRLAPGRPSIRRRLRCPGAYYPGRIPLAEQRVLSVGPPPAAQLHRRPRVAPEPPSSAAGRAGKTRYLGKPSCPPWLLQRLVRRGPLPRALADLLLDERGFRLGGGHDTPDPPEPPAQPPAGNVVHP